MPLAAPVADPKLNEPSVGPRFVDQLMGRQWFARDELLDDAGSDASDAGGLAPVVAEGELVEVSLQMLLAPRAAPSWSARSCRESLVEAALVVAG